MGGSLSKPFIKDFSWYKQSFANKQREIKDLLRKFASMQQHSDIESGRGGAQGSQQSILGQFNQLSDEIQLQIDELEEILKEVSQLQHLTPSERPVQLRLKNAYKELQNEYNQIKVSTMNLCVGLTSFTIFLIETDQNTVEDESNDAAFFT